MAQESFMSTFCHKAKSATAKIPFRIILAWIAVVIVGYYVTFPSLSTTSTNGISEYPYSFNTQSALISDQAKAIMPQAIVFIAMGELSRETLVHDAISAVRLIGHWNEKIIILTDRPTCFNEFTTTTSNTLTITVESKRSIIEIKKMKTEVFSYLPADVERILYMDVDILITRNIGFFLQDLTHMIYLKAQQTQRINTNNNVVVGVDTSAVIRRRSLNDVVVTPTTTTTSTSSTTTQTSQSQSPLAPSLDLFPFDFAAFLDAKGHYVGFCNGCEKWHTGVIYMHRHRGQQCLKAWGSILTSGKFNTDQQSLDYAELMGNCTRGLPIPSRHLLFAKDYIGMLLTSGQTFIHLTAANRVKDNEDVFYTKYIIPRIRNSLHPPLKPYDPKAEKTTC